MSTKASSSIIKEHGTDVSIGVQSMSEETLLQVKSSTGYKWGLNKLLQITWILLQAVDWESFSETSRFLYSALMAHSHENKITNETSNDKSAQRQTSCQFIHAATVLYVDRFDPGLENL